MVNYMPPEAWPCKSHFENLLQYYYKKIRKTTGKCINVVNFLTHRTRAVLLRCDLTVDSVKNASSHSSTLLLNIGKTY